MGLVILKEHPLFHITIPSKLFDYMAMKTPILIGVNGEARRIVESNNIGFYFEPENKDSLVQVISEAYSKKENLYNMRSQLLPTMMKYYNRKKLSKELSYSLKELVKLEK